MLYQIVWMTWEVPKSVPHVEWQLDFEEPKSDTHVEWRSLNVEEPYAAPHDHPLPDYSFRL
jgi:hypothetical protein